MGLAADQGVLATPDLGNSDWVGIRDPVAVDVGRCGDFGGLACRCHLLSWSHVVARQIIGGARAPSLR